MKASFFQVKILILAFFLMMMSSAFADIYMKQKHHVDEMQIMGNIQPVQDFIVESWITPEKAVVKNQDKDIIVDMVKETITIVDHIEKTVSEVPLDFSKLMTGNTGDMSSMEKESYQEFVNSMMQIDFHVVKTAEEKKIGKWNATKYIQTMNMGMGSQRSEIWATTDIKVDADLYDKFSASLMAQMPGMSQKMSSILEEIKKIEGVQVYMDQSTNMMGQSFTSTMELMEFREGKAPKEVFDIPAGYQKTDIFEDRGM